MIFGQKSFGNTSGIGFNGNTSFTKNNTLIIEGSSKDNENNLGNNKGDENQGESFSKHYSFCRSNGHVQE